MRAFVFLLAFATAAFSISSCQSKQTETTTPHQEQKIKKVPEKPKEPITKYFTFKNDHAFYRNDYFGLSMEFSTKTWETIDYLTTYGFSIDGELGKILFTFGPEAPFDAQDSHKDYSSLPSSFPSYEVRFSTFTTGEFIFEMAEDTPKIIPEYNPNEDCEDGHCGRSMAGYLYAPNPVPVFIWYQLHDYPDPSTKEDYKKLLKHQDQILNVIRTLKYTKPKDKKEQ